MRNDPTPRSSLYRPGSTRKQTRNPECRTRALLESEGIQSLGFLAPSGRGRDGRVLSPWHWAPLDLHTAGFLARKVSKAHPFVTRT